MKKLWKPSLFVALFAAGAALWWHVKTAIPSVTSTAPMPNPNAHDYWVKSGNQLQDKEAIDAASMPRPRQSEAKTIGPPLPLPVLQKGYKVYSLPERMKLVTENSAALATFHDGLQYDYQSPPLRTLDFDEMMPYQYEFRSLARLLKIKSQLEAGGGNWAAAMDTTLDGLEFGAKIPSGGPLINMLTGKAIQAIVRNAAWAYIDKLSAKEALALTRRLEKICALELPLSRTLTDDKLAMQSALREQMKKGSLDGTVPGMGDDMMSKAQLFILTNQQVIDKYGRYMDRVIEISKSPWDRQLGETLTASVPTNDPVFAPLIPDVSKVGFMSASSDTQNKLLLTSLALRAYQAKYHKYPQRLADLAPDSLQVVPDDPFGQGAQFRYQLIGEKYLLYSVGPDGKDDGGMAILGTRSVQSTDKGDIVAGINIY